MVGPRLVSAVCSRLAGNAAALQKCSIELNSALKKQDRGFCTGSEASADCFIANADKWRGTDNQPAKRRPKGSFVIQPSGGAAKSGRKGALLIPPGGMLGARRLRLVPRLEVSGPERFLRHHPVLRFNPLLRKPLVPPLVHEKSVDLADQRQTTPPAVKPGRVFMDADQYRRYLEECKSRSPDTSSLTGFDPCVTPPFKLERNF